MVNTVIHLAELGTCDRKRVGALIEFDRRIISTGYNGVPSGLPHCRHEDDSPCTEAVHAEANAIAFAARHGLKVAGARLWTTLSPCYTCATLILNAGITKVRYIAEYRDTSGLDVLKRQGCVVERYVGPVVYPMRVTYGYGEGMHPGEPASEAAYSSGPRDEAHRGWGGTGWE